MYAIWQGLIVIYFIMIVNCSTLVNKFEKLTVHVRNKRRHFMIYEKETIVQA